jgi:hypothetical protein
MSSSNKISIPKEVFENLFFAEGGQKKDLFKALTGEYQFALDSKKPMVEPNAEIEGGEYIFDSQGIRKAQGKTHEKGGMPVALEDGTRILSDHLKIGSEIAKKINKELALPARATDTYAKVLDRFNAKTGLDQINTKLEKLMGMMKDQKMKVKDKNTSDLNSDYLSKQLYKETQNKKPIEKDREKLFDIMFQIQEESKRKASMPEYKMQMGGVVELANKYGISEEKASQLLRDLPRYQDAGEYIQGDANLDGVVNEKDDFNSYDNLYDKNRELLVRSTERGDFSRNPRTINTLPYTPRETSTNPIWQGETYNQAWIPLVKASMSEKDKAKKIDEWLTNNKGKFSPNIQKQLEGLSGEERYAEIMKLATDYKPGPFHNALLQAMVETKKIPPPPIETPPEEVVEETPEEVDLSKKVNYSILGLPQRIYQMPSLQPALKVATRLNRIEANNISPTQKLMETDRAVMAGRQNLAGLSDAARAASEIGLTANQSAAQDKIITDTNRFNNQQDNTADVYNAQVGDREQMAENQNALSYEGRTLRGLSNYENDMQALRNLRFSDQVNNYKTVEMYNAQNASNPQIQYRGTGLGYETNYTPDFAKVHKPETDNLINPYNLDKVSTKELSQAYINRVAKEEADKEAAKKAKGNKPVAKFGGRFKKKK